MRVTGFNHVGLTVSDLDRSLGFYRTMFGLEPAFIASGSGDDLSAGVGVPDARLRFAFLRLGSSVIELLEYDNEREETFTRRNCDVGSAHVCIDVEDINEAFAELEAKGAAFLSPPVRIAEGPLAGCAFAYFPDPDGITVEIFQSGTPQA
jgi:catechol 2,3-dioxygenase-like lactoylglutathione lyase family enzyme